MALIGFGGPAALFAFFPSLSPEAGIVGVGLTVAGVTLAPLAVHRRDWWTQIGVANAWLLIFVGISFRAFVELGPLGLWCGVLTVLLFAVAWALPALAPQLSALLLREQFAPQTRLGRGCLTAGLALLPTAAGVGATLGYFGPRYGMSTDLLLATAALGSWCSIAGAQTISQQMWPRRPWLLAASTPGRKDT